MTVVVLYFPARASPRLDGRGRDDGPAAGRVRRGGFIAERSFRAPDRTRVNDRIRAREIRVVDDDGGQLGVMQPFEAIRLARERGLDLVEISPTADPPVCKITDYGKFLYQTNKKAHEQRKHQKGTQLKEVKFRPATAEHDYQVRKNQIIRFLGEGHKVKAMIFHRGREMAHQEVGRAKMDRLLKEIVDYAAVELGPRMEANILMALLAAKEGRAAAAQARGQEELDGTRNENQKAQEANRAKKQKQAKTEIEDAPRRRQAVQADRQRQGAARPLRQAASDGD